METRLNWDSLYISQMSKEFTPAFISQSLV